MVIACFEKEEAVEETIDYVTKQEYPGKLRVIVADHGSADRTVELARQRAESDSRIDVLKLTAWRQATAR